MENNEIILDTSVDDVVLDPHTGEDIPPTSDGFGIPDKMINCPDGVSIGAEVCPESAMTTVAQFFGTIQESVTISWRMHLKTRKHRFHIALNEYYEDAIKIIDGIIEHYQGINGIVEEPFTNCVIGDGKSEVEYFNELKTYINEKKTVLFAESELLSDIDDLLGLIDSTLYKLTSFCENAIKSYDEFIYEDYIMESCDCDDDECDCNDNECDCEEE